MKKKAETKNEQSDERKWTPFPEPEDMGWPWWWTHPYYRQRWDFWYPRWQQTARRFEIEETLKKFDQIGCDRVVLVRLAFLQASHKPPDPPMITSKTLRHVRTSMQQTKKAFARGKRHIEYLSGKLPFPNFAFEEAIRSVSWLVAWCDGVPTTAYEIAQAPPPDFELYFLVAYVNSFDKGPQYALVTDLLQAVYEPFEPDCTAPTEGAISRKLQRFQELTPISLQRFNDLLENPFSNLPTRAKRARFRSEMFYLYPEYIENLMGGSAGNRRMLKQLLSAQFPE
jgi:hypothetical protein